jgi:hypothetical protein
VDTAACSRVWSLGDRNLEAENKDPPGCESDVALDGNSRLQIFRTAISEKGKVSSTWAEGKRRYQHKFLALTVAKTFTEERSHLFRYFQTLSRSYSLWRTTVYRFTRITRKHNRKRKTTRRQDKSRFPGYLLPWQFSCT